MPRSFGTTNAGPYASAPATGAAGDTYFNTTNKTLYISDGAQWLAIASVVIPPTIQIFSAAGAGTWTMPAAMIWCRVRMVGGGGGGGGGRTSPTARSCGAGGGGAGYSERMYTAAQVGASVPLVVGAGGTGGVGSTGADGLAGGDSTFLAQIGGGGGGGNTGIVAGTVNYNGSTPGAGGTSNGGGTGGMAFAGSPGTMGIYNNVSVTGSGSGGASLLGGGGIGVYAGGLPGNNGRQWGGGGGGAAAASANQPGGDGIRGIIIVEEFYS
jgi:hypothetical protein